MIAQGKAAQQPQPWVNRPKQPVFFRHSSPVETNDEKERHRKPNVTRHFADDRLPLRHEVGERAGVRWCSGNRGRSLGALIPIRPWSIRVQKNAPGIRRVFLNRVIRLRMRQPKELPARRRRDDNLILRAHHNRRPRSGPTRTS